MAKGKPNKKSVKQMPVKDSFGLSRGARNKGYDRAEAEPRGVDDHNIDKVTEKQGGFLKRGRYTGR